MQPPRTHQVASADSDDHQPRDVFTDDHPVLLPVAIPDHAGRCAHLPVDPDVAARAICNAQHAAESGFLTDRELGDVELPICGLCWRVYRNREGSDE
jgi:hypothetical protein